MCGHGERQRTRGQRDKENTRAEGQGECAGKETKTTHYLLCPFMTLYALWYPRIKKGKKGHKGQKGHKGTKVRKGRKGRKGRDRGTERVRRQGGRRQGEHGGRERMS